MKFKINFYLLITFGITCNFVFSQSITPTERLFILSSMWKDVSENFYNPQKLKNINWDSIYVDNIDKVQTVKDDIEFIYLMQRMMAYLEDGHTNFNARSYLKRSKDMDFLPIIIEQIKGKFYVIAVFKKWRENIPTGSEILLIDSLSPIEYFTNNLFPFISGNTFQAKLSNAFFQFTESRKNDSVTITVQKPDKQIQSFTLIYDTEKDLTKDINEWIDYTFFSPFQEGNPNRNTFLEEHKNIMYIRLDQFHVRDNIVEILQSKLNDTNNYSYAILDLRYNTGGDGRVADTLLMCFLDIDTLKTYPSIIVKDNAYFSAMGYGFDKYKEYYNGTALDTMDGDILIKQNLPYINIPLIILISEITCSAAEDFLINLKLYYPSRSIFVGTPTTGSTGAPFVRQLPHSMYYRICTRFPLLPNGMFENGIQPDYFFSKSMEDYFTGEDKIFEYIESILKK
jgi:C-terminal processing protease CtpA/Prc